MTAVAFALAGGAAAVALAQPGLSPVVDASGAGPVPATPEPSIDPSAMVTVKGRNLLLDGRPFRFVGVNVYDAAATSAYSCRPQSAMSAAALTSTLQYLHRHAGATVLRFWAYQSYTKGGTDWTGIDQVLTAARAADMKVLPVLEDGPGDCSASGTVQPKLGYQGDTWYTQGYKVTAAGDALPYRDYVARVAQHYAGNPTILGWSMMNEAETKARDAQGRSALVDFATDVAGVIRSVDPHHLITLGTQANGAPGASGPDFAAVYGLKALSFAEVHDWGYWGSDTEAMPGGSGSRTPSIRSATCRSTSAPIGCSFAAAATLGKPLVVGESGMKGTTAALRDRRAVLMRAKMDAAFAAGASGYLIWSVTTTDTDGYDLLTSRRDPLILELRGVARGLS